MEGVRFQCESSLTFATGQLVAVVSLTRMMCVVTDPPPPPTPQQHARAVQGWGTLTDK